ncbi:MAG: hypothetical protein HPM95_11490 [Alphaproteobacteria bacterium]|nr:hypothetical protein [Alphaproteobacteria bacterium]
MPTDIIAPFLEWLSALPAARMLAGSPLRARRGGNAASVRRDAAGRRARADEPPAARFLEGSGPRRRPAGVVAGCPCGPHIIAVLSGLALLSQRPFAIAAVPAFQAKMALIALAGVNALRPASRAGLAPARPGRSARNDFPLRTAGLISLVCWFGVLALARWPGLF